MFGQDFDDDAIELLANGADDGSKWLRALAREKEMKASRILQQSHARQQRLSLLFDEGEESLWCDD